MKTPKKRETGIYIIRVLTKISPQKPAYKAIFLRVSTFCTTIRISLSCASLIEHNFFMKRSLTKMLYVLKSSWSRLYNAPSPSF